MERYKMKEIGVTTKQQRKRGNSPEILFMGLEVPFKLQSMAGGKIQEVTVENGYYWDGWGKAEAGQHQLIRHGTFTITVKVAIPQGEPVVARDDEYRSIA